MSASESSREIEIGLVDLLKRFPAVAATWAAEIRTMIEPLRQFQLSRSMIDPLLESQILLNLDTLKHLLIICKYLNSGGNSLDHPALHQLIENKVLTDLAASLEDKQVSSWDRQLSKLKSTTKSPALRARPELFVTDDSENLAKDAAYRAPKNFAQNYADETDRANERAEQRKRDQERLRASEFVRAVTEPFLETPQEVGEIDEDLDAESRRQLQKIREAPIESITKKTNKERKALVNLKRKLGNSTVGSDLHGLSTFVDQIGQDRNIQSKERVQSKKVKKDSKKVKKDSKKVKKGGKRK